MNKLIALCCFVLSLYGFDVGGSSFVHRINIDGVDALYSEARVEAGVARFECLHSASGRCHYAVFPRACAASALGAGRRDDCTAEPVERFALANGDRRRIPGLWRFHLCVSSKDGITGPDCEASEPLAAR